MKRAAVAVFALVLPAALAAGALRATRGDQPEVFSAWLHGRPAEGQTKQPEPISVGDQLHGRRAEGQAKEPEPVLVGDQDFETEQGALSLISFLEVAAFGGDDDSGSADGSGVADVIDRQQRRRWRRKAAAATEAWPTISAALSTGAARGGHDGSGVVDDVGGDLPTGDLGTGHDIGVAEADHEFDGDFGTGHDIGIAESGEGTTKKQQKKEKKEKKQKKDRKQKKKGLEEKPGRKKEEFMPECLRHVAHLLQDLDRSYTDEHLSDVLHSTCIHEKHFPLSQSDGFRHKHACDEFADLLVDARDENLRDGTIDGFTDFCERYYEHLYPGRRDPKRAEAREEKQKEAGSWWLIVAVIGLILVLAVGGVAYWYYHLRH